MELKKREIPCIFYLYLHSKVCETTKGDLISRKYLKHYFAKWHIPKKLRELIVRELEILKLIESKDRYIIQLNPTKFNIDNCNKYYQQLKVF